MKHSIRILFIISGLIPVLGLIAPPHDPTLLIYTLFVFAYLNRSRIAKLTGRLNAHPRRLLILSMVGSGLIAECCAWGGNYLRKNDPAQLLHPQLLPDLFLGLGFYGGWGLAWAIITKHYRFSIASIFLITGFMGIFVEANGSVLVSIIKSLSANPLSLALALFVAAVYGSIAGLAMFPFNDALTDHKKSNHWIKYPLIVILMVVGSHIGLYLVAALGELAHLIPPRRPIYEHPFF